MNVRQSTILRILSEVSKASVKDIAAQLKVSEVTTRKDLLYLESLGFLKREHGGAVLLPSDDLTARLSVNYEVKKSIARKALESVSDGETVMIESGSCCALLAEEIVNNRRDITIITNSVFIATYIRRQARARVILLGGEFQNEAQVTVGPLIGVGVSNFLVDKFFIGVDGFGADGAMGGDLMRAEAVRSMASRAKQVVILTESKKFQQAGTVQLLEWNQLSRVYTDSLIDDSAKKILDGHGIEVVAVSS